MRSCEGLVDSLLYVIHTCVNTSDYDSKVCACPATDTSVLTCVSDPGALYSSPELGDVPSSAGIAPSPGY